MNKILYTLLTKNILNEPMYSVILSSTLLIDSFLDKSELNISISLFDNHSGNNIGCNVFSSKKSIDLSNTDYNISPNIIPTENVYKLVTIVENSIKDILLSSSFPTAFKYEKGYIRDKDNNRIIRRKKVPIVTEEFKSAIRKYVEQIVNLIEIKVYSSLSVNQAHITDIEGIIKQMKGV